MTSMSAKKVRNAACGWCLIATFGLPPVAAAEVLYKSIMPDGRIVYGDKPAPGAAKVMESRPDTSKAGVGGTSEREARVLEEFQNARSQRERDAERVQAAQKALREAEAAREAGREPLPGERLGIARRGKGAGTGTGTGTGTAGGAGTGTGTATGTGTGAEAGSRLTDAYWERQKKLEDDAEKARRELEEARSGR